MNRISIVADSKDRAQDIGRMLAGIFVTQMVARPEIANKAPDKYTVFDINLEDSSDFPALRHWLTRRPDLGRAVFVVERGHRQQAVQARALGATGLIERPIERGVLLSALVGESKAPTEKSAEQAAGGANAVATGISTLQNIFGAVVQGVPVDLKAVNNAGGAVVSDIEAGGVARWIDIVRAHHSLTFQHCLLVTGVAVAFGQHLGFSKRDRERLAFGGLLHDIGKAGIPVEILEKPGRLTEEEFTVMKEHPVLGFEALQGMEGLQPEMLDVVLHHHEFLDGSGYPHGLDASQISDLVRLTTIADIFGALLERRAYKAPMSGQAAYQILEKMGPKLDADLVRAFRPFAQTQIK